jgi:hypothetical protein
MGKTNQGFAIVQALIALGIATLASLTLMESIRYQSQQVQNVESKLERIGLKGLIQQALASAESCTANLKSLDLQRIRVLPSGQALTSELGSPSQSQELQITVASSTIRSGATYGTRHLRVDGVQFASLSVSSVERRELSAVILIRFDSPSASSHFGRRPSSIEVPVFLNVDNEGLMSSCQGSPNVQPTLAGGSQNQRSAQVGSSFTYTRHTFAGPRQNRSSGTVPLRAEARFLNTRTVGNVGSCNNNVVSFFKVKINFLSAGDAAQPLSSVTVSDHRLNSTECAQIAIGIQPTGAYTSTNPAFGSLRPPQGYLRHDQNCPLGLSTIACGNLLESSEAWRRAWVSESGVSELISIPRGATHYTVQFEWYGYWNNVMMIQVSMLD